jgi:hypothetical protein
MTNDVELSSRAPSGWGTMEQHQSMRETNCPWCESVENRCGVNFGGVVVARQSDGDHLCELYAIWKSYDGWTAELISAIVWRKLGGTRSFPKF